MKSIMLSIKPKHCANILNKLKTKEIRKRFPKKYRGWVYIYCTKDKELLHKNCANIYWLEDKDFRAKNRRLGIETQPYLNGKVVARFYCDNVEEIRYHFGCYDMGEWAESYILKNSCLSAEELDNYLLASKEYDETKISRVYGCAIPISQLEIFDEPKELSEFRNCAKCSHHWKHSSGLEMCNIDWNCKKSKLTKAPQSWCYVEVKE